MVAPLLALGLGFQGLTRFRDFRKKEKTKQGIEGALDALLQGQDAGALPEGLAGPPRPVGISGGSNLFEGQRNMIEAIAGNNPAAALDMALKFQSLNQQQQNFQSNLGLQSANFELQRDQHELSGRKQDFFESQALRDDRLEDKQLLLETEAVTNRFAAERLAGLRGKDSYSFIDEQTGATTKAFRRGTDPFTEAETRLSKSRDTLETINNLRTNLRRFGQSGDPASPIAGLIRADINALQIAFKGEDLADLGVIAGKDAEFLEGFIPNAQSFSSQAFSNVPAMDARLSRASDTLTRANSRVANQTRGWVGLDEVQLGSEQQQLRAQGLNELSQADILQETQDRAGAAAAGEGVGIFRTDDAFTALFGSEEEKLAAKRRLAADPGNREGEALFRQLGTTALESPGAFASAVGGFFSRGLFK